MMASGSPAEGADAVASSPAEGADAVASSDGALARAGVARVRGLRPWRPIIDAEVRFFRNNVFESSSAYRGFDSLGYIANRGASTCASDDGRYAAWRVARVDMYLVEAGVRDHFITSIEQSAAANMSRVLQLILRSRRGFAKRFGARRLRDLRATQDS